MAPKTKIRKTKHKQQVARKNSPIDSPWGSPEKEVKLRRERLVK